MFKKPLGLKTSTPLRSSDRRKLKQRVVEAYGLTSEEGDELVPDGIASVKFLNHVKKPGVAYTGAGGDPLWFTIGKGSDDLIPTVYTLWKKQDLLPFISTPESVIPILIGGADLMIPDVIHYPPDLRENQLVSIRQYIRDDGKSVLSPPVAIGHMGISSDQLPNAAKENGKAVLVAHTWKDYLWDIGSKRDIPADTIVSPADMQEEEEEADSDDMYEEEEEADSDDITEEEEESDPDDEAESSPNQDNPNATGSTTASSGTSRSISYTPAEVTELLNKALLQAISTTLSALAPSNFPMPATIFNANYLLPSRPAFPTFIVPPASGLPDSDEAPRIETEITFKTSSHKSLTTFLKAAEKSSLLSLKFPQKHSQQTDILVTAINKEHPDIFVHAPFVTIRDVGLKASNKAAHEKAKKGQSSGGELEIKELWKPDQASVDLFEAMSKSTNDLYSMSEIRSNLQVYIADRQLVNANDQSYINLDQALYSCVAAKSKGKFEPQDAEDEAETPEFMRQDDLTRNIVNRMQSWHEVKTPGRDPVIKEGALTPIRVVVVKSKKGRKACTHITRFKPFLVIDAKEMAEHLRKTCAGTASVKSGPGKPKVLVRGKHSKAVFDYLIAKGIPKKWICVVSGKK